MYIPLIAALITICCNITCHDLSEIYYTDCLFSRYSSYNNLEPHFIMRVSRAKPSGPVSSSKFSLICDPYEFLTGSHNLQGSVSLRCYVEVRLDLRFGYDVQTSWLIFVELVLMSLHVSYFLYLLTTLPDRLCGLVVRVPGYRFRGPEFDSRRYHIF
jgi:hypothetical protein